MNDEARYHALLASLPYPDGVSFPERVVLAQPVDKLVAAAEDALTCRSHSLGCLSRHLQRAEIATHRGFDADRAVERLGSRVPDALKDAGRAAYGTFQQEAYATALADACGANPDCFQRLLVAAWLYGLG